MDGDASDHENAETLYRRHLSRFCKKSNSDLWKFFYWDFFHDGVIGGVDLSPDFLTIEMTINAPNIRRLDGEDFTYLNASFKVVFRGVRWFSFSSDSDLSSTEYSKWHEQGLSFDYSEINTHPAIVVSGSSDSNYGLPYSILMELVGHDTSSWLEIVFEQLDVEPDEPLAFSLMANDTEKDATYRGVSMIIHESNRQGDIDQDDCLGLADNVGENVTRISFSAENVAYLDLVEEVARQARMDAYLTSAGVIIVPEGASPFPNIKATEGETWKVIRETQVP